MFRNIALSTAFVLLVFAAIVPVRAAESANGPIPDIFRGYASVSSPNDLFRAADKLIVAATKGQKVNYPPGMLAMLFAMFFPLPPEAWDPDGEAFALILESDPDFDNQIFIFSVPSFEELVAGVKANGFSTKRVAPGRLRMKTSGGGHSSLLLVDLGGGKALSIVDESQADAVVEALDTWRPEHRDEGCVSMYMRVKSIMAEKDFLRLPSDTGEFEAKAKEIADELAADDRISEEARVAIPGTVRLMARFFDILPKIFKQPREVGINLKVDDDKAALSYIIIPEADSYFAKMAAHFSGQGNPDLSLAGTVGPEALGLLLFAPPGAQFPEAEKLGKDLIAAALDEIMPGKMDGALKLFDQAADAGVGTIVVGGYPYEDNVAFTVFVGTPAPKRLMDVFLLAMHDANAAARRLFATPASSVEFAEREERAEDIAFRRVVARIYEPAENESGRSLPRTKSLLRNSYGSASFLVAAADASLVFTGIERGPAWLAKAVRDANGMSDSLAQIPSAREAIANLSCRQSWLLLLSADNIARSVIEDSRGKRRIGDAKAEALLKVFKGARETVVVGHGAKDGRFVTELNVPNSLINRLYAAYAASQKRYKDD